MKAAILHGIRDIRIGERDAPVPGPDEALVRVRACGVCGSDVHYFRHGRIGDQVVKGPHILGHEASGEIVKAPEDRPDLKPGTPVAIEPGIPCGKCSFCLSGRYNICPDVRFLGTPPVDGAYREFMAYPVSRLFPMPVPVSFAEGALVETLAVALYAAGLPSIRPGETVAVLGCGPVGILTVRAALLSGAGKVLAADLIDTRLKAAAGSGNVTTFRADRTDTAGFVMSVTDGQGADVVFEAAGSPDAVRQSVRAVKRGGRVVWIGIPEGDEITVDPHQVRRRELVIYGVRRFRHNYARCIGLVASGRLKVKDLVTHTFRIEDIEKPFGLVEGYRDGIIKAVIEI